MKAARRDSRRPWLVMGQSVGAPFAPRPRHDLPSGCSNLQTVVVAIEDGRYPISHPDRAVAVEIETAKPVVVEMVEALAIALHPVAVVPDDDAAGVSASTTIWRIPPGLRHRCPRRRIYDPVRPVFAREDMADAFGPPEREYPLPYSNTSFPCLRGGAKSACRRTYTTVSGHRRRP